MQFKVEDIKQMIKEELEVILTNEEAGDLFGIEVQRQLDEGQGGEGSMAVGQLNRMAEMVDEVRGMIDEQDDLEEWVESKITKAHDYINTVLNYLSGADDDLDSSEPGLELPQIDRDTFDRMKNIGRQRANPRLKYKD